MNGSRDAAAIERLEQVYQQRIAPRAVLVDREGAVPAASWRDLAEAGYLGLFHAEAQGGSAAGSETLGLAMEGLACSCASTFWAVTISALLCGKMLAALGTSAHQQRWLRPIIAGAQIGCFAATEDGAGCDPGLYQTTLHRAPQGLRLRGAKSRISNACTADVAVVLARDGGASGALCLVVVDLRREGICRVEQPRLGLLGMSWGSLTFTDLPIAEEDVLRGGDLAQTLKLVEWGQLLQAWCALGIAGGALADALAYAAQRQAFGRPIGHLGVVRSRLAEMHAEVAAARTLAAAATAHKAQGASSSELVWMAKIHATEVAVRVVEQALQIFGGWGYSKEQRVERLLRDSLANIPAGLPNDRLRELLACGMLGVSPWTYV